MEQELLGEQGPSFGTDADQEKKKLHISSSGFGTSLDFLHYLEKINPQK